jgi:hypothetical protein
MRETCAVSIIACAAALEAMLNSMLARSGKLPAFDELRLRSKLETIAHWGGRKIDWGSKPWQDITRLIAIRNRLAHYKEAELGLMNTAMQWVVDDVNKPPKIDPMEELQYETVRRYYDAVRAGLKALAKWASLEELEYSFLETEEYVTFYLG